MSVNLRFIPGPREEFHFNALGIESTKDFSLQTNDDLIEPINRPFSHGMGATVFHVHEVMRIVLSDLDLTGRNGQEEVHTNKITRRFERLSYNADSVWMDWGAAVDDAGGSIRTILQRMFGVLLGHNGFWRPHLEPRYIEIDEDWSIIDDVVTTTELLNSATPSDLWISGKTGLRLIRNSAKSPECSESLGDFFGNAHRFPSASSWLQWSMENGSHGELPSDQGDPFYYKGIISNDEVPRYSHNQVLSKGPWDTEWWADEIQSPEVPKFIINGEQWALGMLWKRNEEYSRWVPTYPHFYNPEQGRCVDISATGLGLSVVSDAEEIEGNDLAPLDVRRSLGAYLINEHLRAIRTLLIELGYAQSPSADDGNITGLGLSSSVVPSPFSDTYFLNRNDKGMLGVVIKSPIEKTTRHEILRNNWYVIE